MSNLKRVITDTSVFTIAGGGINVLNYLFIIIAAHFLTKAGFGAFSSLIGCLTIATVITNVLQMEITSRVASEEDTAYFVKRLSFIGLGLSVLIVFITLLFLESFAALLHVSAPDVLALLFSVIALLFSCIGNGLFSAKQRMKEQAFWNFIGTALKVVIGALLFYLGFGVAGGITAYGLGLLAIYAAAFWCFFKLSETAARQGLKEKGRSLSELFKLSLAYLLLILPFSADQILVQTLYTNLSGDYGAIATIGKLVYFATGPVFVVMYSHLCGVSGSVADERRVFIVSVIGLFIVSVFCYGALVLLDDILVTKLLPENYAHAASYIPGFSLGVLAYCLSYSVAIYYLARRLFMGLILVLLPAVILQIFLFSGAEPVIDTLVSRQVLVYFAQFGCALLYWIFRR